MNFFRELPLTALWNILMNLPINDIESMMRITPKTSSIVKLDAFKTVYCNQSVECFYDVIALFESTTKRYLLNPITLAWMKPLISAGISRDLIRCIPPDVYFGCFDVALRIDDTEFVKVCLTHATWFQTERIYEKHHRLPSFNCYSSTGWKYIQLFEETMSARGMLFFSDDNIQDIVKHQEIRLENNDIQICVWFLQRYCTRLTTKSIFTLLRRMYKHCTRHELTLDIDIPLKGISLHYNPVFDLK